MLTAMQEFNRRNGEVLGVITGHIPYNVPDHRGHVVTERSFRRVLSAGASVPIMLAHQPEFTIGYTSELRSDPSGLRFSVPVPNNELGQQLLAARRNGHFAYCSTCTRRNDFRPTRWHGLSCEHLNSCDELGEISLTGSPMQPRATNQLFGERCPDSPLSMPSDFLRANMIQKLLKATGAENARRQPLSLGRRYEQQSIIDRLAAVELQIDSIIDAAQHQPGTYLTAEQQEAYSLLDARWDRLAKQLEGLTA